MEKLKMALTFDSSLTNFASKNSSFDTGVLKVCYTGQNRNGSSISKDAILGSLDSIYNIPVVCNYDRETDTIGSHDVALVNDEEGHFHIVNLTDPVGVIPESANTWFETDTDENGNEHEYLCTDVLLWKRQEAYSKIKRDGIVEHSMEILIKAGLSA